MLLAVCLFAGAIPAGADKAPDPNRGALYGRVIDLDGKPVVGATVALREPNGKVRGWAKTGPQGEYVIATDPLATLRLRPSRRRGLLDEVVRGVGQVVTAPVEAAKAAVKVVTSISPVETVKSAAVSAATGNPTPIAAQVVGTAVGTKDSAAQTAREAGVKAALGENGAPPKTKPDKGEALLAISAPGYRDVNGPAGLCWLEPLPGDSKTPAARAWMETIKLAPATGNGKSEIVNEGISLADARLEPALVPAGGAVKITVRLAVPTGVPVKARLFARELHRRQVVELKAADKGLYAGEMTLDPKVPIGDTVITIAALRTEPIEVRLDAKKADPYPDFVRRLDDLEPKKPYDYDARIFAAENRVDLNLTILDPKMATPAPAPPPHP